ncbi:M50 family metallopeptidase [Tsukamurella sp. M9C]|uniref:M50 family metallopeptidase n=1 Tax=unclassified Tsukamurella TaxID=2633480 RepID=UPI001CCF9292|nr:M50 family metallopeptidase [Tsukamurella sp. M9C]MCA0156864.1 M50 family metallopeptidase [Tsukamurella sp. M9C]
MDPALPDALAHAWDRVVADVADRQPAPSAAVLVGTAVAALVLVLWRPAWRRARHVVTIAHEGGHAVTAVLCGRRLSGVRLHSDTSGLTVSRGRPRGPGMVTTFAAGYPAPTVIGLVAAVLLSRGYALAALWAAVLLLALLLLQIRNFFGLYVVLLAAAVVVAVSWWAAPDAKVALAHVGTWFLLFGAPRAVAELQSLRRRGRGQESDADQLARLTRIPGGVWVALFAATTVGGAVLGVVLLAARAGATPP